MLCHLGKLCEQSFADSSIPGLWLHKQVLELSESSEEMVTVRRDIHTAPVSLSMWKN